ncbi:hypothetical protein Dsin_015749 [Dipteronia sinensis]|uniref:Epidermal patterning factor-like protein n=1 Tax=Dipteronia sinensis TaxID=43782 RepID=A0AAE0E6A1_9ROSI|nr:hypothetical protein Dsin_015749 [Dipteronia sinensis]
MNCLQNLIFCQKFCSLFIFFLLILSSTQMRFMAEAGRANLKSPGFSQTVEEDKTVAMRAQIGSRPPRCERRCSTCGHCEAIQVPTNPQVQNRNNNSSSSSSTISASIAYARGGDDSSNYKPMSWKCKCGKFIFDP